MKECGSCNRISGEMPGLFLDFDADANQGSCGIALCSKCLGTGVILKDNEKFEELSKEVSEIRSKSLGAQIEGCKGKKSLSEIAEPFNKRLVEISQEALTLITEPVDGCYAQLLAKK